jgi:hypothetical protein
VSPQGERPFEKRGLDKSANATDVPTPEGLKCFS